MTTLRTCTIVSLAVTMTVALGACAGGRSRPSLGNEGPSIIEGTLLTIRFDNRAREYVHVYLVGEQRQWLLGRVEPGARAVLRVPEESLVEGAGLMRLAVLTGARLTLQAARDPRATFTIAQPAATMLSQQWAFSQGQLTSFRIGGMGAKGGRQ